MDFTNKANDAEALLQFQDFGMGSTSTAGKPPPYEQTHNFSNYPTSHVDIDEVPVKRSRKSIQHPIAILSSELINALPVVNVWAANIIDKKATQSLVKGLSEIQPILHHLKRVKSQGGQLKIIIGVVNGSAIDCKGSLISQGLNLDGLDSCDNWEKVEVNQTQGDSQTTTNTEENVPSMLSFAYYQRYFDVDTLQVKERLMWSFLPRPSRDTLTHYIRPSPDLYGPLWICVTLVFCIAVMGNIADYMHSGGEGQHWRYDFRKVSISATTIFSYALLLPLILWLLLWWRRKEDDQAPLGFIEIVSLYGYSLAIYIPISVLWTIPLPFIQWTLVIVGAALSGSVLVLSLWPPLSTSQRGMAVAILSAILAFHFLLAAGLQLYFFRYANSVAVIPQGNGGSSPGHILTRDTSPVDKVTELQPLNLIRDFEENGSTAVSDAKATGKLSSFPTFSVQKESTSKVAAISTNEPTSKEGNTIPSVILNTTTKLLPTGESTTAD
uniref:EOG090X0CJ3 n=1 Tax=Ceriodaphnia reticulata TaxID=302197 RepID=A0A4Y7LXQ8_9CRUS|nr:EOG090X0CJ3 [Ceriodaphnia reticulata]SVE73166.1 EOG090X0CJ3 [Ceriodaphnia reticulata]